VLSSGIAQRLFPYQDPLGRRVFLSENKDYYEVIGVLEYRTPTAAIGGSLEAQDFNSDIYIPISTLRQRIGDFVYTRRGSSRTAEIVELNQITLRVKSVQQVRATADLVRKSLRVPEDSSTMNAKFTLAANKGKAAKTDGSLIESPPRLDVAVIVPEELLEQARLMKLMLLVVFGLVAAISLIVGGIGIMNIMLATVTERTREIGIRRALGATRMHIIMQFLVETISLSVVGGLTGILGGLLCPAIITGIRNLMYTYATNLMASAPEFVERFQPVIVIFSLPLAFFISVIVGVVFGLYPAYRAAQMDPIEALRHE
jgi:putative ABC transport system permease protein